MSNIWHYRLLLDPQPAFPINRVAEIVEMAKKRGFFLFQPETGRIVTGTIHMTPANYRSYEFDDFIPAATVVLRERGTLYLWRQDYQIGIGFDPMGVDEANLIEAVKLPDIPSFGHLSISVEAYVFRDYQEDRAAVAQDVKDLFADLCVSQKARYGFSVDEDAFELFAPRMRIHEEAKLEQAPSVLFWLTYFTSGHWSQIGQRDKLQQLGARVIELPTGVLVSFFANPWDVDLGKLYTINEGWRI